MKIYWIVGLKLLKVDNRKSEFVLSTYFSMNNYNGTVMNLL
jgi:hypothetical protein